MRSGLPESLITIGCIVFILVLAIAAVFVPDVRLLHVFQALLYVVTILLSLRRSRWGHFTGISVAGLWNYIALFVAPIIAEFVDQPARPDLIIQGIGWFANLSVIVGCVWAYFRLPDRSGADIGRFFVAFVLATAFLALVIAVFSPGRLEIFPRMLHPHLPWLRG